METWFANNLYVIVVLVIHTVSIIIFFTRLADRVNVIEERGSPAVVRLELRVSNIETKQQMVIDILRENGEKLDSLILRVRR